MSVFGVILVRLFSHSYWIRRDTLSRENGDQNNFEYEHHTHSDTITIYQLDIELRDLKNRSLRKTLVFRNIKNISLERKTMQDFSKGQFIKNIGRAHRVTTANRNFSATSALNFFVAKITNWKKNSEKNKSTIIKTNQKGKVSRQYLSPRCTQSLWRKK